MRSFDDPCGSWQGTQLSRTGACSHKNGPRLSAWHDVQLSLTVNPARSRRVFLEPCTLWHDMHSNLPSRTGMWPERSSLFTLSVWQVAHCMVCELAFRKPFSAPGLCTL